MRTLTLAQAQAALAQETEEVFLDLVELSDPLFGTLRFVDNTENVTSNGVVYTKAPFTVSYPSDENSREPVASLTIGNITKALIDEIRKVTEPFLITVTEIMASAPDTPMRGPLKMEAQASTHDDTSITLELRFESLSGEPLGWVRFTPEFFPGMFAS